MPNFVIHARFTTRADKRDTFLAKYKEIAAQAKQHEKECLAFHLSEDPTTPNSFALFELYSNKAAWEVTHMSSKPSQEMYAVWNDLMASSEMLMLDDTGLGFNSK